MHISQGYHQIVHVSSLFLVKRLLAKGSFQRHPFQFAILPCKQGSSRIEVLHPFPKGCSKPKSAQRHVTHGAVVSMGIWQMLWIQPMKCIFKEQLLLKGHFAALSWRFNPWSQAHIPWLRVPNFSIHLVQHIYSRKSKCCNGSTGGWHGGVNG